MRRGSLKKKLGCLSIVRFSYFLRFQTEFFSWMKLFFAPHRFFSLDISSGTHIAAVIGHLYTWS